MDNNIHSYDDLLESLKTAPSNVQAETAEE